MVRVDGLVRMEPLEQSDPLQKALPFIEDQSNQRTCFALYPRAPEEHLHWDRYYRIYTPERSHSGQLSTGLRFIDPHKR